MDIALYKLWLYTVLNKKLTTNNWNFFNMLKKEYHFPTLSNNRFVVVNNVFSICFEYLYVDCTEYVCKIFLL